MMNAERPARARPHAAATTLDPCCNTILRKATRNLGQLFDGVLAPCGLRAAQLGVLAHIEALEAPTMKALARALVMDLSALGHTLKPLARDGYVALAQDPRDRRAKRVSLTADGRAKYRESAALWHDAQARFEAAFGSERASVLRKALAIIASEPFAAAFREGMPTSPQASSDRPA